MNLLADLTDAQAEAVSHVDGPLLVVAGPGSGKTRVITRRVAYLVDVAAVAPRNILAITFTNKAAAEMRGRIEQLIDPDAGRAFCSTFHSFCATFLRRFIDRIGFGRDFVIFDRSDSLACIKEAMDELRIDAQQWRPAAFGAAIAAWKDRFVDPDEAERESAGDYFASRAAKVYAYYLELLRQRNGLDFDDLLVHMVRILKDHDEVRETLQYRFQYILIDEYQDTNHAQYLLARYLTGVGSDDRSLPSGLANICVTGDPDQSIYGWRGADIGNILRFEEDFPSARVVKLEQNYRSTKLILAAADGLIRHNRDRKEKDLFTDNVQGRAVEVCLFEDEYTEARAMASRAADLVAMGTLPSEIAIFYRVNALSRPIEQALWEQRLPYVVVGALEFYARREIKDILGYLRVLANPRDDGSVVRVINTPTRGIGKVTVERLRGAARERGVSLLEVLDDLSDLKIPKTARASLGRFRGMLEELRARKGGPVADLVARVIQATDYEAYLEKCYPEQEEHEDRIGNVRQLVAAARHYDDQGAELGGDESPGDGSGPDAPSVVRGGFAGFLDYTSLLSEQDALEDGTEKVSLMTLHTAKGLEFDHVLIAGIEDGTLPHSRSKDTDSGLEEERRLLFVGMTRARKGLCLTYARWRTRYRETERRIPSPFLAELPDEAIKRLGAAARVASAGAAARAGWGGRRAIPARDELDQRSEVDDDESFAFGANSGGAADAAESAKPDPEPADDDGGGLDVPKPGERVYHQLFGAGIVKEISGRGAAQRVVVVFDTHGVKKLVLQYAKLARSRR